MRTRRLGFLFPPGFLPVFSGRVPKGAFATVLALGGLLPLGLAAQGGAGECPPPQRYRVFERTWTSDTSFVDVLSHFVLVCEDGRRIEADSAVMRSPAGRSELMGNVVFLEGSRVLHADEADYYMDDGRLVARMNVLLEDLESGREIRGDALNSVPASDTRDTEEVNVTGRPAVALLPNASGTGAYTVRAQRIQLEGETGFRAFGDVEVLRDSLRITSDSLLYSDGGGTLRFGGEARMTTESGQFRGEVITLGMRDDEVEWVLVEVAGRLIASGLDLFAEEIRVTVLDGEIERLVAVHRERDGGSSAGRPHMVTADFFLAGDSIEVFSPGGVIETVDAIGRAWGQAHSAEELLPDPHESPSVRLLSSPLTKDRLDRDWIEGDRVQVFFEQVSPENAAAEAEEYQVRRLTSSGAARALYRRRPGEGEVTTGTASSSQESTYYQVAETIVLHIGEDGEVERIEATGGVAGVRLVPLTVEPPPPASAQAEVPR